VSAPDGGTAPVTGAAPGAAPGAGAAPNAAPGSTPLGAVPGAGAAPHATLGAGAAQDRSAGAAPGAGAAPSPGAAQDRSAGATTAGVPGPEESGPRTPPGTASGRSGSAGRELASVVALCAAGGGLALLAAGRPWLRLAADRRPPLPDVSLALTGRDLEPLVAGLGVVGLAGALGLLATRRWGRLAVAVLVTLAGLGMAATALTRLGTPGPGRARALLEESGRAAGVTADATIGATAVAGWPLLAVAGGLLLAAGGLLAVLRSRRWPTMSSRYEAPAARRSGRPAGRTARSGTPGLWDALDRGEDPTR